MSEWANIPWADRPKPGSKEAGEQGCICAVLDNRHGAGYYAGRDGEYVVTGGCPIHDPEKGNAPQ